MKRLQLDRGVPGLSLCAICLFALVSPVLGDATADLQNRLLRDVKYLASEELQGRGVETEGLNKAADFVRDEFTKAGLDVTRVDNGAFHKFTMITNSRLGSPNTLKFIGPKGKTIELKYDTDFRTCSFSGSGSFAGELVFCGYGIDAPNEKYQDFNGIDVKGKVVVIMRRVPQQTNPHGPFGRPHGGFSRHGEIRSKVSNAFGQGAAAILFVNDPHTVRKNAQQDQKLVDKAAARVVRAAEKFDAADSQDEKTSAEARKKLSAAIKELKSARQEQKLPDNDPLMKFGYGGGGKSQTIPIMHVTQSASNQLLGASLHKSLEQLAAEIDQDLKPRSSVVRGWSVKGEASIERVRSEVKNVIGVLEGEGPLADETIVIGAHYDHLGLGGQGSFARGSREVHNGADDNASGTASLLELARRLAARAEKIPRRLVFIAFTAEERGLIGSARYVKEPVFPLENTIAMFNMDMVGRLHDDKLTVFGSGTAPRWKGLIEKLAHEQHFKLTLKPSGFGPSDQSSFYAKKIPVLHFFTGVHQDYHRPSDDWDKINVKGMARVVEMIEDVVLATAQSAKRPKYLSIARKSAPRRGGSRPYFGSIPDFSSEESGYAISGVGPGSPAEKGGLKGGDHIIQLGLQKIGDLSDFDLALRKFSAGDEIDVVVLRNGKRVSLKITLVKPR